MDRKVTGSSPSLPYQGLPEGQSLPSTTSQIAQGAIAQVEKQDFSTSNQTNLGKRQCSAIPSNGDPKFSFLDASPSQNPQKPNQNPSSSDSSEASGSTDESDSLSQESHIRTGSDSSTRYSLEDSEEIAPPPNQKKNAPGTDGSENPPFTRPVVSPLPLSTSCDLPLGTGTSTLSSDQEDELDPVRLEVEELVSDGQLERALSITNESLDRAFTMEAFQLRILIHRLTHDPLPLVEEIKIFEETALLADQLAKIEFGDLEQELCKKEENYKQELQAIDSVLAEQQALNFHQKLVIWRLLIEAVKLLIQRVRSITKDKSGNSSEFDEQLKAWRDREAAQDRQNSLSFTNAKMMIYFKELDFLKNISKELEESPFIHENAQKITTANDAINQAEQTILENFPKEYHPGILAQMYEATGEDDEAIKTLTQGLGTAHDPIMRLHRAKLYCRQGDYEKALRDFQFVCKEDPNQIEGWVGAAQVHLLKRDLELCFEALMRAPKELRKKSPVWILIKAQLYRLRGRLFKVGSVDTTARELLDHIIDHKFDGQTSHLAKAYFVRALVGIDEDTCCEEEISSDLRCAWDSVTDPILTLMILGEIQCIQGEYQSALGCYETVLKENSNDIFSLGRIASIWDKRGEPKHALCKVNEALKVCPQDPEALKTKGCLHLLYGNFSEAYKVLDQASKINSYSPDLLVALATACTELERYEEAEHYLKKALRSAPSDRLAERLKERLNFFRYYSQVKDIRELAGMQSQYLINEVEYCLRKGELQRALACTEAVLSVNPTHYFALKWKGEICRLHGWYADAKYSLEAARQQLTGKGLLEEELFVYGRLAEVDRGLGNQEMALKNIGLALKRKPDCPFALSMRAVILADQGKHEEAIAQIAEPALDPLVMARLGYVYYQASYYDDACFMLRKALEIDSRSSLSWTLLGDVYARNGRYEYALEAYDIALKWDPDYRSAKTKRM